MRNFAVFAIVLSIILWCGTGSADPTISNVGQAFRQGDSVVITGSNFGIKESAAPLFWDDFEHGTAGQLIEVNPDYTDTSTWSWANRADNLTLSDQNNRPGSATCSKHDMDDYYTNLQRVAVLKWGSDVHTLKKLYITFWVRMTFGTDYARHQVKMWRVESHDDESIKFAQYNWGPQDPAHYYQRGTGTVGSSYGFGGVAPHVENQWFQIQFQAEQSSQSTADGSIEIWHSRPIGSGTPIVKVVDLNNLVTRDRSYYWDRVLIGEAATNLDHTAVKSGVINYFDDVYIDRSWARVELGNAATWSQCTIREIQIPTAWSNTSITVTANSGSLQRGAAYLYVTDSQGVRNETGYPVTIEASSKQLAGVIDRWQSGELTRDDVNRAVYWYLKGTQPVGDPMAELTEEDIGNAIKLTLEK